MKMIAFSLAAMLCAAAPTSASASDGLSVTLEIDEPELGGQVQVGLHLVGPHGCASVSEHRETTSYKIQICRDDEQLSDKEAVLTFELERTATKDKITHARKFRVKSRLALGKKLTVGRWATGDEKGMELRATAR